jgi:hypothetical protein
MPPNIQFTNKLSIADGIKCVIYGASGVGKTCSLATAPNPFIFSAEKGLLSLRKLKIPYVDVSTYKELVEAYKWFQGSNEAKYIGTLGLDSVSEIAEVILSEELKNTKDARQAYGKMQNQMGDLMRSFRDVKGRHVVLLAKEIQVDIGMVKKCVPLMPSSNLLAQLPYFWDLVLHLHIGVTPTGTSYRAFHTNDSNLYSAKDRSGNLGELEEVNLTKLFEKAAS